MIFKIIYNLNSVITIFYLKKNIKKYHHGILNFKNVNGYISYPLHDPQHERRSVKNEKRLKNEKSQLKTSLKK